MKYWQTFLKNVMGACLRELGLIINGKYIVNKLHPIGEEIPKLNAELNNNIFIEKINYLQ